MSNGQKSITGLVMIPTGESNTRILLRGHNIKQPS